MRKIRQALVSLPLGLLVVLWCYTTLDAATPVKAAPVLAKPVIPAAETSPGQSFGDWGTRCFPIDSGAPCDMFQVLVDNRSKQRVMSVSLAYAPLRRQYLIQIAVPLEVALRRGLFIQTSSYRSGRLEYRRCTDVCLVETTIDAASLAAMGKAAEYGSIIVSDRLGRQFSLRLSLNGFSAALAAMTTLNQMRVH